MHQAHRALVALSAAIAVIAGTGSAQAFTYVSSFGSSGTGDGQFQVLNQIAVDPAGNIYATDGISPRIEKFSPDGTFLVKFGGSGAGELKLGLAKKALVKLRKALRSHRSLRAAVTVTAKDAAGRIVFSHRTVKLTR